MAFHDDPLPDTVERGAKGAPGFYTVVAASGSGFERRSARWADIRGRYSIGYGINEDDTALVIAHFMNRMGMLHSFPFKDWVDYIIGDPYGGGSPQSIGTGDGATTTFDIVKIYERPSWTYTRTNILPVTSTVRPFIDNVEQFSGFTVDRLNKQITFTPAPGNTLDIAIHCEFQVPVRYDTDELPGSAFTATAASIGTMPLVEVKGEA